jgi:tetratricopeptide (TPR) repeat protein
LALAYKRLGNWRDARAALQKIATPDANVWLQMGLLSLREKQLSQAAQEFERAWQLDQTSYAAGHNLLLTRLSLGELEAAAALVPHVIELAPEADEQRQFTLLRALLQRFQTAPHDVRFDFLLNEMTVDQEERLLDLLRSLGQLDTIRTLLKLLLDSRPQSAAVRIAYLEATLLKAKQLLDRCDWLEAEQLLSPLAREKSLPRSIQTALLNLLGCSACLCQDTAGGVRHFAAAVTLNPQDARIQQNTALAHEWVRDLAQADPHWNRFFKLLDERWPVPPHQPQYVQRLSHDALCRLAATYTEQQLHANAIPYLERAHRLLPDNIETLDRLFHHYNQAKRAQDARRVLAQLKELRPGEPQFDLYELDVHEVRDVSDIERVVTEIGRILQVHPNDPRVEDRAVHMVGNVLPLMGRLCDQLTDQLNKVMAQVRSLPNYQIKWEAVHEIMRDLKREFLKLKRITSKCMPLAMLSDHRRMIHELSEHIDRKIEFCQRWEGR